jgi:ribosomal-protein-alanine N-acetyltransferase
MLELNFKPFPQFETERLLMRAPAESDVQALFAMRSDAEVMRFIGKPLAKSPEDAAQLLQQKIRELESNTSLSWAICERGRDVMIGTIGFWRITKEHHRAEVGYMFAREHWGRGLAGEALTAAVAHGFQALSLHSIQAIADARNTASMRVLERAGFVREAYFREDYLFDGEFLDSAVYSLLSRSV